MVIKILISGFGGQGMISLGKILAKAALLEDNFITGFPSYGAEMRGGTAHCFIKISDAYIASPIIDSIDIAIILNQPSLDKFKGKLRKGNTLILNSDLVVDDFSYPGIKKVSLPLNKIALNCGNIKVANIVALGALVVSFEKFLKRETIIKVLKQTFTNKSVLEQNLKAFTKGLEFGKQKSKKHVKS